MRRSRSSSIGDSRLLRPTPVALAAGLAFVTRVGVLLMFRSLALTTRREFFRDHTRVQLTGQSLVIPARAVTVSA